MRHAPVRPAASPAHGLGGWQTGHAADSHSSACPHNPPLGLSVCPAWRFLAPPGEGLFAGRTRHAQQQPRALLA